MLLFLLNGIVDDIGRRAGILLLLIEDKLVPIPIGWFTP